MAVEIYCTMSGLKNVRKDSRRRKEQGLFKQTDVKTGKNPEKV